MADEEKKDQEQEEKAPEADAGEKDAETPKEVDAPTDTPKEVDAPAGGADSKGSDDEELSWKDQRRLERSRQPHEAGPQRSPEERAEERGERRTAASAERSRHRKRRRSKREHGTGTPPAERATVASKVRQGTVVSSKSDKTITVRIDVARRHPTYEKVVRRSGTLHAHDESNEAGEGDLVQIVETRPLSKTKRWRLDQILEKAK